MKLPDFFSERMVFGLLVFVGYIALVIIGTARANELPTASAAILHDGMLALGPLAGMIIQSVFKSDRADKQNAQTAATLATAVVAAQANGPQPQQNGTNT